MGTASVSDLVIRADASVRIGAGHIMRCLALAQAWQADDGGQVCFLSQCESADLRRRIESHGFGFLTVEDPHPEPHDLQQLLAFLNGRRATILVLDGYHFDPAYQQAVRAAGYRLLVIDDTAHLCEYRADWLLNQNIYADQLKYVCDSDTVPLLGTRYVLLRSEFLAWRGWRRTIPETARHVLVSLGGSDPDNATRKVIEGLRQANLPELQVKVVVGPANPHLETLRRVAQHSPVNLKLLTNLNDMPALMAWADVAISGGGSTCWELAFMGVPVLALVLAENQRRVARQLDEQGVAINLGDHAQLAPAQIGKALSELVGSAERRAELAHKGQQLIDGDGVERVLMRLRGQRIRLRRVRETDKRLLWEWANDPDVRAVSFSVDPIPWERHRQWFDSKLNDPQCVFLIAINAEEQPVGQVRYEFNGPEAVVSIGLDTKFRGQGYGRIMLASASQKLFRISQAQVIHAFVKPENHVSVNAFLKAGFRDLGLTGLNGQEAIHLVLPREAMR